MNRKFTNLLSSAWVSLAAVFDSAKPEIAEFFGVASCSCINTYCNKLCE